MSRCSRPARCSASTTPTGSSRTREWDIQLSKTGYIREAGKCLVMLATIASRPFVIVLLDSRGKYTRLGDAQRVKHWLETGETLALPSAGKPARRATRVARRPCATRRPADPYGALLGAKRRELRKLPAGSNDQLDIAFPRESRMNRRHFPCRRRRRRLRAGMLRDARAADAPVPRRIEPVVKTDALNGARSSRRSSSTCCGRKAPSGRSRSPLNKEKRNGHVRLRGLRAAAVRLGDQVRQRHRLAELLRLHQGARRDPDRHQDDRTTRTRVPLRALRRPPRPRLRRRPEAHRIALLRTTASR